jgi:hypothetical protein
VTLAVCATLGWVFSPESLASPQMHLLSGATMLGAFFILTDPVTASTTNRGRLIFGALAGCWYGSSAALAVIRTAWRLPSCWPTLPFRSSTITRVRACTAIAKGFAMLKTMQKHGVTLAVFAAVLTGLTALVND